MLKKILIGLLSLIVLLVAVSFLLPRDVHVERSIVIDATPTAIWPHVSDFDKANAWSPWAEHDPNTKYTFEGQPGERGHKSSWVSEHDNVGTGSQTIVEAEPGEFMKTALDFGAQGTAEAFFKFASKDGKTEVTWGFDSDMGMNPIGRYMGLMMEDWIGPDYEKGLSNLKALVEKGANS